MQCPTCGTGPEVGTDDDAGRRSSPSVDRTKVRTFPFCSPRCRDVDLGRWLSEEYRFPDQSGLAVPGADDGGVAGGGAGSGP
jgi:endogenous inhibitor of DNA gyrase (YacG/DUF329 family)